MRGRLQTLEAGRPERKELQESRRDRMSEAASISVAPVERYFRTGGNSAKLVVTEFGGFTNVVFHGQCAVEENAEALSLIHISELTRRA